MNRFEDANALLTKMQLHVGHISALMNPLTYVIINLAIVALLYVGSVQINVGRHGLRRRHRAGELHEPDPCGAGQAGQPHRAGEQGAGLCGPCAGRAGHRARAWSSRESVPGEVPGREGRTTPSGFDHVGLTYAGRRCTQPDRHQLHGGSAARPSASSAARAAANPASSASSPAFTTPPRAAWRSSATPVQHYPRASCAAR